MNFPVVEENFPLVVSAASWQWEMFQ